MKRRSRKVITVWLILALVLTWGVPVGAETIGGGETREAYAGALVPEAGKTASGKETDSAGDAVAMEETVPAYAEELIEELGGTKTEPYLDENGQPQVATEVNYISNIDTIWASGWYSLSENITLANRVTVEGDVKLILPNYKKLTANNGIEVTGNNSLTIYAQSHGAVIGCLEAAGGVDQAGIGGGKEGTGGEITINGGRITATGGGIKGGEKGGAGIGGGSGGDGRKITINGGTISAKGGASGAGIGGGQGGAGGAVTINGGKVTATGAPGGAGIGGGQGGAGGEITINGGTISANGELSGAGIGGGLDKDGGSITINDGTILAIGGYCGAGIGGGQGGAGGEITINGGTIQADGTSGGAGIGGGQGGAGGAVTINGGKVTAAGGTGGAGIGGGQGGAGGAVTINGGKVTATGGTGGAGIGGGMNGSGPVSITLSCNLVSDQIYASSYNVSVNIVEGRRFIVNNNPSDIVDSSISGNELKQRIDGKLLTPLNFNITMDGGIMHGSVSADSPQVPFGSTVKLTVTPEAGYHLKELSVKQADGTAVPVNMTEYSFAMPASDVTVSAVFAPDHGPKPIPTETGIWVAGISKNGYPYTGAKTKPRISVYFSGTLLTEKKDYSLKYSDNVKVGEGKITITGKGNFKDKKTVSFNIVKADLGQAYAIADTTQAYKKGKKHDKVRPALYLNGTKLKFSKQDVSFSYLDVSGNKSGCEEEGNYIIRVSANEAGGHYTGFADIPMTVTAKPMLSKAKVKLSPKSVKYTGKPASPAITVTVGKQTLTEGKDYALSYEDVHTDPGKHYVTISGNNKDYFGRKRLGFQISGKYDLSDKAYAKATVSKAGLSYKKSGAKPEIRVIYKGQTLQEGTDYKVKYSNNKKAGETAICTVQGKGSYKGKQEVSFKVQKCNISSLSASAADRTASKKADDFKKTAITFTDEDGADQKLKAGQDYEAVFTPKSGTPQTGEVISINLTGKGENYTGTAEVTFRIKDADYDLSKAKCVVHEGRAYDYTGEKISPSKNELKITIKQSTVSEDSYDITGYYNNVNTGTATLTIKGKGGYYGEKKVKFKIGATALEKLWGGVLRILKKQKNPHRLGSE